jgi:hypothetical protein
MSVGPRLEGKVLSEAALIGWAVLHVSYRLDFLGLIDVLAGFFENWEKPARFLDLLLEPFLPMPI